MNTLELLIYNHQLGFFQELMSSWLEAGIILSGQELAKMPDESTKYSIEFKEPNGIFMFGMAWQTAIRYEDRTLDLKFTEDDSQHVDEILIAMDANGAIRGVTRRPASEPGKVEYRIEFHTIYWAYKFGTSIGLKVSQILEE